MKNLWKNIERLRKGKNYLWGDGYNASYMYYVLKKMDVPIDGFIRVYNKNVKKFSRKSLTKSARFVIIITVRSTRAARV